MSLGLLALIVAYVLYVASYVLVERRYPDRIVSFPFEPFPPFRRPQRAVPPPQPPPAPPRPTPPRDQERRQTVVQHGDPGESYSEEVRDAGLSLEALEGPLKGQRIVVSKAHFQVGAGSDSDLRITSDDYLSSTHALLLASHGPWLLVDQDSLNGTFVDGQKLASGREHMLQHGQSIRLGASEFRVVLERETSRGGDTDLR